MNTSAKLALSVAIIGAGLLLVLWWQWPWTTEAVAASVIAAVALSVAAVVTLYHRHVTLALRALLRGEPRSAQASREFVALAGHLDALAQQVEQQRSANAALTAAIERERSAKRELQPSQVLEGAWEWQAKGEVMHLSAGWKALLGFAPNEFSDTRAAWKNRIHLADVAQVEARFNACAGGQQASFESEHRLLHKDLSPRWVLSRGMATQGADAQVEKIVGYDIDITAFKNIDDAHAQVAEATASATGSAFFRDLVRSLAGALGVDQVVLTQCQDFPATRVRTLALWKNGAFGENVEYQLEGTPCLEVISSGMERLYSTGLREVFAKERHLAMDSYLGVPVLNADGVAIGHLALMHRAPMTENGARNRILRVFAARAAAEMSRARLDDALARLVTELESLSREERLQYITRCFSELLGVREAIVTRCVHTPQAKLLVLAWWRDGRFEPTTEYNLVGTTCEETINEGKICVYPNGVGLRFPPARAFERESYVGVPCFGADKNVIGHLAAFHNKLLPKALPDAAMLQIFAERAAIELRQMLSAA